MRVGVIASFAVLCATVCLSQAAGALAHTDGDLLSDPFPSEQSEVATHQAEHEALFQAEADAHEEWAEMTPREREAARIDAREAEQRGPTPEPAPARRVGRWTQAPFELPTYAIHAALLPTGKVLFWGYPPKSEGGRPNEGEAALWNPALGTGSSSFEEVNPPMIDAEGDGDYEPAPLYCSGQSFLPNGALLVAGGNYIWPHASGGEYTDFSGLDTIFTFNPWADSGQYWVPQPSMEAGRWYPTQVLLADGRTAIFGGYNEDAPGNQMNNQLEVFSPHQNPARRGTVRRYAEADQDATLYPHMFTLPDGNVLSAGPYDDENYMLDPSGTSPTWSDMHNFDVPRIGGTGIIRPRGTQGSFDVMLMGGYGYAQEDQADATNTTEVIDASDPQNDWQPAAPMNEVRSNHNTVQLPDRTLLTVGGGNGRDRDQGNFRVDPAGPQRAVELFDPKTNEWRLGPAQQEDRAYHSTAVLLPDGRVWSAGDDAHPTVGGEFDGDPVDTDTAEIYSPPYLFKGSRPVIEAAPRQFNWRDRFAITAPGVTKAVLIAPGATTHAVDMNQRLVPLELLERSAGGRIKFKAPPSARVAPPGYYMLFALNREGVPSVARWVGLGPDAVPRASQ